MSAKKTQRTTSEQEAKSIFSKYVSLKCLECRKKYFYDEKSLTGQGVFNCFCDATCEEKYAWKQ